MCGDVIATSLEDANKIALEMNGKNGVTECKAIGALVDRIDDLLTM